MNLMLFAAIVVLFAIWTVVHVQLCVRIMRRNLRRGMLALLVMPLAPYWGHEQHITRLPTIWMVSGMLYLCGLIAGLL